MVKKTGLFAVLFACVSFAHAADYYGAIAFNKSNYRYGYSYDYKNQADANRRALNECGRGCQVVIELMNECGAVYKNDVRYAWSNGNSRQEAERNAKRQCGSDCSLVAWACTTR